MICPPGKRSTLVLCLICLIALIPIAAACQGSPCRDALGCIPANPQTPIKIGLEVATIGEERFASARILANLQKILAERAQTNLALNLELVTFETNCSPAARQQDAARIAASKNLAAVIAPACQAGSGPFLKLLSDAGLLVLSPVLSEQPAPPGVFQLLPGPAAQASALVESLSSFWSPSGLLVAAENIPDALAFSAALCTSKSPSGPICQSQLTFETLADLPAALAENAPPAAMPVLVLARFSQAEDLADLRQAAPDRSPYYFYDPTLSAAPPALSQDPFPGLQAVVLQSQDFQPFSDCAASASLEILLKVFSANPPPIHRQAMRNTLQSLAAGAPSPAGLQACALNRAAFSILPFPTP